MLLEALQDHRTIGGAGNPWVLTESLIGLFDELTLHEIAIPDDSDHFARRLAEAYGLASRPISAQSREAVFVHTLWQAWLQQHRDERLQDQHHAYIEQLTASLVRIPQTHHFYLAGFERLLRAEALWLRAMMDKGQATWLIHGASQALDREDDGHPDAVIRALLQQTGVSPSDVAPPDPGPLGSFLDQVYAPRPPPAQASSSESWPTLAQRARAFAARRPDSPAATRLSVCAARDAEEEARAVDTQIRRWFLEGKQRIAVISEDRRLARRLRALLERAGILLEDHAGWALSTTSAAATLERLLQTVEEDYAHEPLLDLLKSPFIFPHLERAPLLKQVYRLENDIILHENIPRNLARYRQHIVLRRERLGWGPGQEQALLDILDALERACAPLQDLATNPAPHAPERLLDRLGEALRDLGLEQGFLEDEAGQRVLQELRAMREATADRQVRMSWLEFRNWLGRALERATFIPARCGGQVQLFTLAQSRLQCFDALVIAGADEHHIPGPAPRNPFFNDAVRAELGLPRATEGRALQFHHFRRLLESAPQVLLTYHHSRDGEDIQPSPWLALLDAFHELAYGQALPGHDLAVLARQPASEVVHEPLPPSLRPAPPPRPSLPATLIPRTFSAGRYQQLLDCPYQFFAASGLGLQAPEAIREALEKSDYGERVHRILERFHDPENPKAMPVVAPEQREEAARRLERISRREFRRDLEDNLLHQGWLQRWLDIVPAYIDWCIARSRTWRPAAVEQRIERPLTPGGVTVKGRLDRIDRRDGTHAIVDYKTGAAPAQEEVEDGEAVQLPFYALLSGDAVVRSEYLLLEKNGVRGGACLEDEDLAHLAQATGERLASLAEQMEDGAPLPAWGDEKTCDYCPVSGVCRKQAWDAPDPVIDHESQANDSS
ncbi:MAG TPA: DNA helicase [Gammaproteobacteria bacterium]|nr:DNA helicase [Gammaproteobacteria bacterium]